MRSKLVFRHRGIGLPAAIFVITLLVVIMAAVNLLVEQNAQTYGEEINLTRAFFAAETGAGIAMNTIFPPEEYPSYRLGVGTQAECAAGPRTYNFTSQGLANCSAEVRCDSIPYGTQFYATIESTGTCDDVSRTIQVRTAY